MRYNSVKQLSNTKVIIFYYRRNFIAPYLQTTGKNGLYKNGKMGM